MGGGADKKQTRLQVKGNKPPSWDRCPRVLRHALGCESSSRSDVDAQRCLHLRTAAGSSCALDEQWSCKERPRNILKHNGCMKKDTHLQLFPGVLIQNRQFWIQAVDYCHIPNPECQFLWPTASGSTSAKCRETSALVPGTCWAVLKLVVRLASQAVKGAEPAEFQSLNLLGGG